MAFMPVLVMARSQEFYRHDAYSLQHTRGAELIVARAALSLWTGCKWLIFLLKNVVGLFISRCRLSFLDTRVTFSCLPKKRGFDKYTTDRVLQPKMPIGICPKTQLVHVVTI